MSPIDAIVHVGRQQLAALSTFGWNSELLLGIFEALIRQPIECALAGGGWNQMALATSNPYGTQHCCSEDF